MIDDGDLEQLFGPPEVAAADLHELRVWTHARTMITPTDGSRVGRELCARIDPTWPARGLTNERVMSPPEHRPRQGQGSFIKLAESTIESMMAVAAGSDPPSTRKRRAKMFETLWPAQHSSWQTWVMSVIDITKVGNREMRLHSTSLDLPYVSPSEFMMGVREGATPYLSGVAEKMELPRNLWKLGALVLHEGDLWTMGLNGFRREWLDLYPKGELALWLRSFVCNGYATSHQLATYMHLEMPQGARSCEEGWIS